MPQGSRQVGRFAALAAAGFPLVLILGAARAGAQTPSAGDWRGVAARDEAERQIRAMLDEAFRVRGEPIAEMRIVAVDHRVERIGCALAAITLLGEEDLA